MTLIEFKRKQEEYWRGRTTEVAIRDFRIEEAIKAAEMAGVKWEPEPSLLAEMVRRYNAYQEPKEDSNV